MAEFPIPEGYALLVGLSKENARQALAEAVENGYGPETVLTRHDGFLIPMPEGYEPEEIESVPVDEDGNPIEDDEEEETPPALPDDSWTNAKIDEWAGEQTPPIDLGGATVKADKLNAINTELAARAAAADEDKEVE